MRSETRLHSIIPATYLAIARRWWLVLLLAPLLGAGSAYWFFSRQQPVYSSSTTLFVSHASPASADVTAAKLLTKTYSQLVTSQQVLEQVQAKLTIKRDMAQLAEQIKTTTVPDTQIIRITVEDRDPQMAAQIANSAGAAFVAWIAQQQAQTWSRNSDPLQNMIAQTLKDIEQTTVDLVALQSIRAQPTAEEQSQVALLEARLQQYQSNYRNLAEIQQRAEFAPQGQVLVTDTAEAAVAADRLPPLQIAALAFALCFGLALTAIVLIERFMGLPQLAPSDQPIPLADSEHPLAAHSVLATVPEQRAD